MRTLLPRLIAILTRHPRLIVKVGTDFEWSYLWTYNLFRIYELMFGRRAGIRHELSAREMGGKSIYYCHSLESIFVLAEVFIRDFFPRFQLVKVYIPQFAPVGMPTSSSPYMLAIAFDTSANGGSSTSYAYTVTGSNPFLVVGLLDNTGADPNPTATYNSVSMNLIDRVQYPSDRWTHLFILQAPATGSNTIAIAGTSFTRTLVSSYSGCAQTGQPDSHSNTSTTGTPWVQSTTVVASNCWLVGYGYGHDPVTTSVSPGVIRQDNQAANGHDLVDSNGTVSTGSQSISWSPNAAGRTAIGTMVSVAPVPPTVSSAGTLLMMGV